MMAAEHNTLLQNFYGPKHLDLIHKVIEKTRQGKILWKKTATGMTASVDNKIELSFVRNPVRALFGTSAGWSLFAIRDEVDCEILRVDNLPKGDYPIGPEINLVRPIDELFLLLQSESEKPLQKAIDLIDKI